MVSEMAFWMTWEPQDTAPGNKSQQSRCFDTFLFHPRVILGLQSEKKWIPKLTFCRKLGQKRRSFSIMAATVVFSLYLINFWSICDRKIDENFSVLLHILSSFPTLPKPCILQAALHVVSVFRNVLKS